MAVRCATRIYGTISSALRRGERSSGVLLVGRHPRLRANEQQRWLGKPLVGARFEGEKASPRDASDRMALDLHSPVDCSRRRISHPALIKMPPCVEGRGRFTHTDKCALVDGQGTSQETGLAAILSLNAETSATAAERTPGASARAIAAQNRRLTGTSSRLGAIVGHIENCCRTRCRIDGIRRL